MRAEVSCHGSGSVISECAMTDQCEPTWSWAELDYSVITIMSRVEDKKMDSNVSSRSLCPQISHTPDQAGISSFRIFLNIFLQPSGGSGAFMACVHGMLGNLAKFGQ